MVTTAQLLAFTLAAIVITATPGPDNLMVLGMGVSRGRRAGIAFGLGCAFGCLSHTALAVLGVSALIAASPLAFTALRWVGGAYLVWLGVNAWRHAGRRPPVAGDGGGAVSLRALFLRGVVANAINPKVVLFFLSFLPQFVVPAQGRVAWQLGLLGLVFAVQAAVLFGLLGGFAGTHRRVAEPPAARRPVARPHRRRGVRGPRPAHGGKPLGAMAGDAHDLERFVQAQARQWADALAELRAGRQADALDLVRLPAAARARPQRHRTVLRPRGRARGRRLLAPPDARPAPEGGRARDAGRCQSRSAVEILGEVDAMKFRSCLTLFLQVAPDDRGPARGARPLLRRRARPGHVGAACAALSRRAAAVAAPRSWW